MPATIRVIPSYTFVMALPSLKRPVATVDGREHPLAWDEPADIPVPGGTSHELQVDLRVFGLHGCRSAMDTGILQDGETAVFKYRITLLDRIVSGAHLERVVEAHGG